MRRIHTKTDLCGEDVAEREFEKLYLESYPLVYGYVRARMLCDADAEDIVAETYLKAARAFSRFDSSCSKFSTWVMAIARNCMASYFRTIRPTVDLDDIPESFFIIEGGQGAVDNRDLALQLLAVLNDIERRIVLMKYRDDMRNVDIAAALDMNASTVASRLARAIAKMRTCASKARVRGAKGESVATHLFPA